MNFFWVFVGGGLGSLARYLVGLSLSKWVHSAFPWATFVSNVVATGILGITVYLLMSRFPDQSWMYPFLAIGFCGGFSTFSTFSYETLNLLSTGNYVLAGANILFSFIAVIALLFFLQHLH